MQLELHQLNLRYERWGGCAKRARTGIGYQTLINETLGQHIGTAERPITAEQVRKIVRDELANAR